MTRKNPINSSHNNLFSIHPQARKSTSISSRTSLTNLETVILKQTDAASNHRKSLGLSTASRSALSSQMSVTSEKGGQQRLLLKDANRGSALNVSRFQPLRPLGNSMCPEMGSVFQMKERKTSSINFNPINTFDKKFCHEVVLRINSNWGNPSVVSCSKIDIIDDKKALSIDKIILFPKFNESVDFAPLISGALIKEKGDERWMMKWPPAPPLKSLDIIFSVYTPGVLETMRIWPLSYNNDENIRNCAVMVDKKIIFNGDIANNFGINIPLKENSEIKKVDVSSSPTDEFGILPFTALTSLTLQILESYNSKTYFGIQHIMLFDSEGDFYDSRSNGLITAENCGNSESDIAEIFYGPKDNMKMGKKVDPFKGELTKNSRIVIKFSQPVLISTVVVVTLKPVKGPVDIGVKKIRVFADRTSIYTGKMVHNTPEYDSESECTNIIFLFDNEHVRENVFRNVYPIKSMFFNPDKELVMATSSENFNSSEIFLETSF